MIWENRSIRRKACRQCLFVHNKFQAVSILGYILKISRNSFSARHDIRSLFRSSRFYIIRNTADIPPIQFALCTNLCSNKAQTFRAHLSHSLCFRYLPVWQYLHFQPTINIYLPTTSFLPSLQHPTHSSSEHNCTDSSSGVPYLHADSPRS